MSCVIVGNSELWCFMSQYFCAPLKSSVFTADNFLQPETHLMTPPQVYTMLLFCFFALGSSSMLQESLRYLQCFLEAQDCQVPKHETLNQGEAKSQEKHVPASLFWGGSSSQHPVDLSGILEGLSPLCSHLQHQLCIFWWLSLPCSSLIPSLPPSWPR